MLIESTSRCSDSGNHFQAALAENFDGLVELDDFLFYAQDESQFVKDFEAFLTVCNDILKIKTIPRYASSQVTSQAHQPTGACRKKRGLRWWKEFVDWTILPRVKRCQSTPTTPTLSTCTLFGRNPEVPHHIASKLMRWVLKKSTFRYILEHILGERNLWTDTP